MAADIPTTKDQWGNTPESLVDVHNSLSADFKSEVSTFVAQRLGTHAVTFGNPELLEWPSIAAQMGRLAVTFAIASGYVTPTDAIKAKDGEVVSDADGLVSAGESHGHYL